MTQDVRASEFLVWKDQTAALGKMARGSKGTRLRRALAAVDVLVESALRDEDSEDNAAVLLLEAVAEADRRRTAYGAMPAAEREAWESVGASFADPGVVGRAKGRAAAAFAALLQRSVRGDAAVAKRLNVDRSRVSQRLGERSLYAIPSGDERYYPLWQLDDASVLRGLKSTLVAMDAGLHPLTVDHWFNAPNLELTVGGEAMSPVEWLRTGGKVEVVAALAADL